MLALTFIYSEIYLSINLENSVRARGRKSESKFSRKEKFSCFPFLWYICKKSTRVVNYYNLVSFAIRADPK